MTEATLAKAPPIVVSYSKVRLTVVQGPDTGVVRDLVNRTVRIGSSLDNDLVLNDGTVSRHHCAIETILDGVRICDEGSTNGVFLGRIRLLETIVFETVVIQLGDTHIRVEPLSEVVSKEQLVSDRFGDMLGRSARMREMFADLERIAKTDVTLLVEGETGTGKELVADSVHRHSLRANRPFITFDCSAIAPTLIESELFGTVPGAYSGAVNRAGVFEQAHGGTIFLDELGELPKELQPKLLRVLERREVKRLGSERTKTVDVRVISATHRNLAAEVTRGNFREDLFFRLTTAQIQIPPLRDRMQDLPLLVGHFLERAKSDLKVADISSSVWSMFTTYRWPGNVRELWNAVQRLLITPDRVFLRPHPNEATITPSTAPSTVPNKTNSQEVLPLRVARREASDRFEREYLSKLMAFVSGNRKNAANVADVSKEMIRKLLIKHGLE
jgi:transcriptional regulator with PAS, ATPase and Fis domain